MTIGIAVSGPLAGLAVYRALQSVEKVGRGGVGGFVSYAVITPGGELLRAATQRGGASTLFTKGELTGIDPPDQYSSAELAVLISSGPDRPEPLSQFTPGDAKAGLITGHRLPNTLGIHGRPINECVLNHLRDGKTVEEALKIELDSNADADAGFIAMNRKGDVAVGNTALTQSRDDLGCTSIYDEGTGLRIGVVHNSIFPHHALTELVISTALDTVKPEDAINFETTLNAGMAISIKTENALFLSGSDNRVESISVVDNKWSASRNEGVVLRRGTRVYKQKTLVGKVVSELYCVSENGVLSSLSGSKTAKIGIRSCNTT